MFIDVNSSVTQLASGQASGSGTIPIPDGITKLYVIANLYGTCSGGFSSNVRVSTPFTPYNNSLGSKYTLWFCELEVLSGNSFTFSWSGGVSGGGTKLWIIY